MLVENNRQRVKSFDEVLREQVVMVNREDAYRSLIEHRQKASRVSGDFLELIGTKKLSKISSVKFEFVNGVIKIVNAQQDYWPLSDRSIHYDLLNCPPLRNSSIK